MRIYSRLDQLKRDPARAPEPSAAASNVSSPGGVARRERRPDDDRALSDGEIRAILGGISKPTLHRYRKTYGLPGPHFRLGQRPFTWRSAFDAWLAVQEQADTTFVPPMNRQRRGTGS